MAVEGDDVPHPRGPEVFLWVLLFEAAIAPVALAIGLAIGRHPLESFSWDWRAAGLGVLASGPMIAVLLLGVWRPVGPLGEIKQFFDREMAPIFEGRGWPDLLLVSLAAGIGEEMLFRGVVQGLLMGTLGRGLGLAASAVIFGLMHPVTRAYAIVAGIFGAYLGGLWLATGNLLVPMAAHSVYDFVALLVLLSKGSWGSMRA